MKITHSNEWYQRSADSRRVQQEFQQDDFVMVRVLPERFQPGVAKKLLASSSRLYKVLKQVRPNAYMLNLPSDLGISSTFHVDHLISFHGPTSPLLDPFSNQQALLTQFPQPTPPPPPLAHRKEVIEGILDEYTISMRQGGYQKYLLKWKDTLETDCTLLTQEDLQRMDPDLVKRNCSFVLPEASSYQSRGVDEDTRVPHRVY